MTAPELVEAIERLGVRVRVVGGEIDLEGDTEPSKELLDELVKTKADVVAYLIERGDTPAAVRVDDHRVMPATAAPPPETKPDYSDYPHLYGKPVQSVSYLMNPTFVAAGIAPPDFQEPRPPGEARGFAAYIEAYGRRMRSLYGR